VFSMSRLISSLSVTFQLVYLTNLHRQRHTCIGVVCSVCSCWSPFEVVLTKISFSEIENLEKPYQIVASEIL
jgi:hypothetical protein